MSSRLPFQGEGLDNDVQEPATDSGPEVLHADQNGPAQQNAHSVKGARRKPLDRTSQAIDDAQQGLTSLLQPPTGGTQPRIISKSGAARYHTRGRIAGPAAGQAWGQGLKEIQPGLLLDAVSGTSDTSLAIAGGDSSSLEWKDVRPQSRIAPHLARANTQMQAVRERAGLLVNAVDGSYELGELGEHAANAAHVSRRSASQWATRYATHLVIVLVVGTLVAMGGLKSLTVQGANPNGLHAVDAYTGTDHFDDEGFSGTGKNPIDSLDYQITIPRTELGESPVVAGSMAEPAQKQGEPEVAAGGNVAEYTVAAGDTIESVAAKYNLMPETIMGSNGIYDSEEVLEAGRTLIIPPIDGMYYVASDGDTVETVAARFQVDPNVILTYAGNGIDNGTISAGQPLIVPGGMMPARDTVVTYTVRRGDSLKDIAARYGVDV
ncbi:MAG TPA: LysM peptidoglycan-binding domain-containing protein, partial [Chloroflexia bacterium]|nr:LysM peptidoglycan-binding domain-containing protein [Chloroflexia bacterium]